MNLLDEQMREDQGQLLGRWGIRFRQIGREIAMTGIQDPDIIPWLHTLKRPTFFTHDQGFFKIGLCHPRYCLVWLDVSDVEAAIYIRRYLRHRRFDTNTKRMGIVARVHHDGVHFWQQNQHSVQRVPWPGR